jgi:hypothetical protein
MDVKSTRTLFHKGRMLLVTLIVVLVQTAAAPPAGLRGVSPEVITTGATPARVTLLGQRPGGAEVTIRSCDGSSTTLRSAAAVLTVPATLRHRPCVLRLGLGGAASGVLLPVADPAVLALKPSAPVNPADVTTWSGRFSSLCESDTTAPPRGWSLLSLTGDSVPSETFVLGREARALMRLEQQAPATVGTSGETCRYVLLPGIEPGDVQWGPKDVEGLWLATLSPDGRTLHDRVFLADMVSEPSGPLDR